MRILKFHSTGYNYSEVDAYNSAISNIDLESNYIIQSIVEEEDWCDGCNDYHYYCTITVKVFHSAPTDLEVRLRQALGL